MSGRTDTLVDAGIAIGIAGLALNLMGKITGKTKKSAGRLKSVWFK